jgi:branched-subunit amino acid aminotransferase/4-amino-4-deoxychorismate lyase
MQDSGWVAERRSLEQQKGDAVEVLLSTRDGRLLEGLVTNLFVVTYSSSSSTSHLNSQRTEVSKDDIGGSSSLLSSAVVWTAGMEDSVVWGTVRAAVLEACHQLGVAVCEEAPNSAVRHEWQEAFITNGLRLVQPLTSISCDAGNVWGHDPWVEKFAIVPGPVTTALSAAVVKLLPAVDADDL